jgi:DNA-binding transcriptional MerR regulator
MTQYFSSFIIVNLDIRRYRMDHNKYMTTGEFARRMGVTKNTLFHYDNIGLFLPEIVDTNDYRYYSIYQMEVFDTIIILKEMGMPLNEIKEFMDHRSPESLMELFEKEDKKITEQIKRLKYQQQFIRGRKEKMKGIWSIDFEHVFRKKFPNRYYIYEEIRDETDAGILKNDNCVKYFHLVNGIIAVIVGIHNFR